MNYPSIAEARLPATYEAAKAALAICMRVDECKDWADKMAALASYAKQADDDALYKLARRIQGRAVHRCGELLNEINGQGARTDLKLRQGVPTKLSTAREAGLSRHKQETAVRVANIPKDQFEALIEGDDPPSVTALAELGTATRPDDFLEGLDPEEHQEATAVWAFVCLFTEHERAASADLAMAVRGMRSHERQDILAKLPGLRGWLDRLEEEVRDHELSRQADR